MKISSSSGVAPQAAGSVAGRPAQGRASEAVAQPGAGATVSLSELSAQLVSTTAGPDFDHAKVESIKQAIADGKLSVNADAVADKLIANALALSAGSAR
jgi:negative regulator of flagellin synthesis FlgM